MRVIDPESLTRNNLVYREPLIYDELLADDSLAADLVALAPRGGDIATVLDLGCGTARLLAELCQHGLTGTGLDMQRDIITWARRAHPGLRLEIGDLRTVRLDATFDLVVCVGNTLSYLHTEAELAAAFDSFAAHSHNETLLALSTLTGAGRDTRGSSRITTSLGAATVDTASEWDPTTGILTSTRTWRFATGRVERDTMHRRFWDVTTLAGMARNAGFEPNGSTSTNLTLRAVRAARRERG